MTTEKMNLKSNPSDTVLSKLIDKTISNDLLFLSAIIVNIMRKEDKLSKECSILPELFSTLGIESTLMIIKYFGGEKIQVPSREEMYAAFLIIVCYYKNKIEKKSWEEIKKEIPEVEINTHNLGKVIKLIDDSVNVSLEQLKLSGIQNFIDSWKGRTNG